MSIIPDTHRELADQRVATLSDTIVSQRRP